MWSAESQRTLQGNIPLPLSGSKRCGSRWHASRRQYSLICFLICSI
jgi:hypothetical protein